jgi:hypothetical protein
MRQEGCYRGEDVLLSCLAPARKTPVIGGIPLEFNLQCD